MSRSGVKRSFRLLAASLLLWAGLAAPVPAVAETVSSPQVTGVEMTTSVRQSLKRIEEQWLQWNTAYYQNNPERAKQLVDDLLATARQLEMSRLPDLSTGALVRSVEAARQGDFVRAHWALEAAERLDPGRPETVFAGISVARLEGGAGWLRVLTGFFRVYPRLFGLPLERYLWFQDLLLWTLSLLLVTGGLFIAVQMATQGRALFQDLVGLFARRLPRPVAVAVAIAFLVWPVFLPFGLVWLALLWSLLLWGYGSTSERVVLIGLWLLLGLAPLLLIEQQRRVTVALSPPVRAMQGLEQRRLYGGLFADLGMLRSMLPESTAVKHLLADVHRSLDQGDLARSLYRQVLQEEPDNTAALLNMGAYFYLKDDFGNAIEHFKKASDADPQSAAAQFNLSQAYSESYLFDEQKAALAQARQLDSAKVAEWIRHADQQRIVTSSGGMARIPEIRQELLASFDEPKGKAGPQGELFRHGLSLLLSGVLIVLALALHLARRPFGYSAAPAGMGTRRFDLLRRVLVPGVSSAEAGEGGKGFFALLVPMALLMLPFFQVLGYRIPWGYDPGNLSAWIVAILGLGLYFGVRLRWERSNEV
ncbi:MAG TPA: hypothetical protein VMW27_13775 [Thermoanaerobaculia bacterium]|nr:hypothetical protein [Thermoanaerobaculia bacterium]